jgi:MFS family permease
MTLGASIGIASLAVTSVSAVPAIGQIPVGLFAGRFGRSSFLVGGSLIAVIGPILSYFSPNVLVLIVTRLVTGLAQTAFMPVAWATAMDFASEGSYGKSMGNMAAGSQIGVFLGPLIGGFVAQYMDYRLVFIFTSLLALPSVLLSIVASNRIAKTITGIGEKESDSKIAESLTSSKRNFSGSLLAGFVVVMGVGVFSALVPIYLVNIVRDTNVLGAGIIISMAAISQVVVRAFLGFFSDRYGRRTAIVVGLFTAGLATAIMIFRADFLSMVVIAILYGFGASLVIPAAAALITESVPTTRRGFGMGAYISFLNMGTVAGTTGLGYLAQGLGFDQAFGVMSCLEIGVAFSLMGLIRVHTKE